MTYTDTEGPRIWSKDQIKTQDFEVMNMVVQGQEEVIHQGCDNENSELSRTSSEMCVV